MVPGLAVKHLKHTLNSLARYLFIDRGTGALGHGAPPLFFKQGNVAFFIRSVPFWTLNNIQLLDETEQNIVIYKWRADQLFAEGRGQ